MNIQILDSWLREYLETKARPEEIAQYVSLCGPSFEKIEKIGNDYLYEIETTTNRVDCMSVVGIARECAAILPQFGLNARFLEPKYKQTVIDSNTYKIDISDSNTNAKRIMAVVLSGIENTNTPDWMKKRLEASGIRSLNAIIDITNYIMTEIGHPTHVFDYDKLKTKKLIFRKSKKGEKITTLDGKTHTLPGGDIVIDDGTGEIVDLPGIMGAKNSAVSESTKNIVFFINNNDEVQIRKTSMTLAIRTVAATLNEKGVDPELAKNALLRGVELYRQITKSKVASEIFDYYPNPYKPKTIKVSKNFIDERIGKQISSEKMTQLLQALNFKVDFNNDRFEIIIPSARSRDVEIEEDIVEEIARIYGYHNLPSILPFGDIPDDTDYFLFKFEKNIRDILARLCGYEVYTSSLVDQSMITRTDALKLKNPLGEEGKYLRTSLIPSLTNAVSQNKSLKDEYFLYEIANVYIPKDKGLPEEISKLGIIFVNYEYRKAKGILEKLLQRLNIKFSFKFINTYKLELVIENEIAGEIIINEDLDKIICEFDMSILRKNSKIYTSYKPTSKYPAHIEDYTFEIPESVKVGDVINVMLKTNSLIQNVSIKDIYKNNYTFTVTYHDHTKTLTDKEIAKLRKILLDKLKKTFNLIQK